MLLALVDRQEDIAAVRDHLAMELAKAATKGNAEVNTDNFLAQHGLIATPLFDWVAHRTRAAEVLQRTLARRNYESSYDIRREHVGRVPARRVLVVTGESGTGKSWMVNALADASSNGVRLPIVVEAVGSADHDLQKASETFWHEIHDGDEVLHISRIARRLRKIAGDKTDIGVTVFVDGVSNYMEASQLVQNDWYGWHSLLVLSCNPEIAASLQSAFPHQVDVINCQRFSWEQLHELLDRRLGADWPAIPEDVRDVLKLPLLAGIYCEELGNSGWLPTSEYELYERVWKRLSSAYSESSLDTARVESLAHAVREGAAYPWTAHQLLEHGVDDASLKRLMSVGWLVRTGDDRYRIFHDRLLQWAVAKSLCIELLDGRITQAEIAKFICDIVTTQSQPQVPFLGFVPMDVLWILSQAKSGSADLPGLLAALEATDHQYLENLYDNLVPTIGSQIADAVFARYRDFKGSRGYETRLEARFRKFLALGLKNSLGRWSVRLMNISRDWASNSFTILHAQACWTDCGRFMSRVKKTHPNSTTRKMIGGSYTERHLTR